MKFTILLSLLTLMSVSANAATIGIAFHNGATTVAGMGTRPDGTVVSNGSTTWNNPARNGGVGPVFTGFALINTSGAGTGATLGATSGFTTFNNNGWGTNTQDHVMMEGWYGFVGAGEFITIDNLPAAFTTGGYTVTIYGDSASARVMDYTIGSTTQTITDTGVFTGSFSAENQTTFTGLSSSSFTITGNATGSRSAVNGILIQSVPEPGSALLGLIGGLGLMLRRRRA